MFRQLYDRMNIHLKLMIGILLSLAVSVFVFFLCLFLVTQMLDLGKTSSERVQEELQSSSEQIQAFVNVHALSLESVQQLDLWLQEHENYSITIYDQNYNAVYYYNYSFNDDQYGETLDYRYYQDVLTIEGVDYQLELVLEVKTQSMILAVSVGLMVSGLLFGLLIFFITGLYARKLKILSNELDMMQSGFSDFKVSDFGRDEIGQLSHQINELIASLKKNQIDLEFSMQMNQELITNLSHDLRTPLTVLKGYLTLIEEKRYSDPQQLESFLKIASLKVSQISEMSNELFGFFASLSLKQENNIRFERLFVHAFTEAVTQMIRNDLFDCSAHLSITTPQSNRLAYINSNTFYLQRLISNVTSNIRKYADLDEAIAITFVSDGSSLLLTFTNRVNTSAHSNSSSGYGILACTKIMEIFKGSLNSVADSLHYQLTLRFPIDDVIQGENNDEV